MDIVLHLTFYLVGCLTPYLLHHLGSYAVGNGKVGRTARRAYPAEWAKTIVEEHWSHDILHVRRIAKTSVTSHDVGTGTLRLQQEGVAIIEEIHA